MLGAAFVIETSGALVAVEPVAEVRAISNRTTIADFDRIHRHPGQPVAALVDARWHASQAVLAARPVTVESLAAHLRSHDSCAEPGWSVCMHARDASGRLVEATTSSMIAELRPTGSRAWISRGSPCETMVVSRATIGVPSRLACSTCAPYRMSLLITSPRYPDGGSDWAPGR